MQAVFRDRQEDVRWFIRRRAGQPSDPNGKPDRVAVSGGSAGSEGKDHGGLGLAGRIGNGPQGVGPVAADQLLAAVDDHLRGVDTGLAEPGRVTFLAVTELGGREGVNPAQPVPVIDMFAQNEYFCIGDLVRLVDLHQQFVGGGAARTALRREEFHQDRHFLADPGIGRDPHRASGGGPSQGERRHHPWGGQGH